MDIAGLHGDDQVNKHREYIDTRDAVILVFSKELKDCIEHGTTMNFIIKGIHCFIASFVYISRLITLA